MVQTAVGWLTLHYTSSAELGHYYVFVAWTLTLGWVLGFGLPEQAMRIVSVAYSGVGQTQARSLCLTALSLSLASGALTFLVLKLAVSIPSELRIIFPSMTGAIWSPSALPEPVITAFGVTGLVGSRVAAQLLKSCRLVTLGLYTEFVIPFTPLVIGAWFFGESSRLDSTHLIWLHVLGGFLSIFSAIVVLTHHIRRTVPGKYALLTAVRQLLLGVGPQWFAVAMQSILLNAPLIAVSILADAAAAGIFGLCMRLAAISMIGTDVIIAIRGPSFAEFHTKGEIQLLQRSFSASRRAAVALAVPITILLIVFSQPILRFFGVKEVAFAQEILIVLLLGRLIYAFVGPVSYFLWMIRAFREEIVATVAALTILVSGTLIVGNLSFKNPTFALSVLTTASLSVRFVLQFFLAGRKTAAANLDPKKGD
ncbi:MAG: hypothetical protein GC146_11750 [Limimaricola sp.]|uniref:lipopolysaccharide biosynthesis protein n=1 Tax=Limimaricola sp. TaxID=2211665 RepID=UPI001DE00788|nr:hypothetical protein [Limimaricola sp.]MBI1417887.1 hypothetical protein [Limimaricola sp.]